jgi:hypothetical protein
MAKQWLDTSTPPRIETTRSITSILNEGNRLRNIAPPINPALIVPQQPQWVQWQVISRLLFGMVIFGQMYDIYTLIIGNTTKLK